VGAWIEIVENARMKALVSVAPCVGAWIEIPNTERCGPPKPVAPCVGAWIEIVSKRIIAIDDERRSLRGSVD